MISPDYNKSAAEHFSSKARDIIFLRSTSELQNPFCKLVFFCTLPFSLISLIFSSRGVGHKPQKMKVASLLVHSYHMCKFCWLWPSSFSEIKFPFEIHVEDGLFSFTVLVVYSIRSKLGSRKLRILPSKYKIYIVKLQNHFSDGVGKGGLKGIACHFMFLFCFVFSGGGGGGRVLKAFWAFSREELVHSFFLGRIKPIPPPLYRPHWWGGTKTILWFQFPDWLLVSLHQFADSIHFESFSNKIRNLHEKSIMNLSHNFGRRNRQLKFMWSMSLCYMPQVLL